MLDTTCIGLVAGQILGRWGNFFNREAFGGYTDNLFAMQLPVSAVRVHEITDEMWAHVQIIGGEQFIQVHPTFLYESLWNVGVICFLYWYRKRKKFQGELFLTYLLGYGLGKNMDRRTPYRSASDWHDRNTGIPNAGMYTCDFFRSNNSMGQK